MAAMLGFTDAQIADVLRKGLPKLNENDKALTAALEAVPGGCVHDLGSWQDYHAEKDLEESQRGSGQDAPASRCPLEQELLEQEVLEQELLGRRPQWHSR
jgi:hypothetical protein